MSMELSGKDAVGSLDGGQRLNHDDDMHPIFHGFPVARFTPTPGSIALESGVLRGAILP